MQVHIARLNAETASKDDHGLVLERLDQKSIDSLPLQEKYALLHLFSPDLLIKSSPIAANKQEQVVTDLIKSILT